MSFEHQTNPGGMPQPAIAAAAAAAAPGWRSHSWGETVLNGVTAAGGFVQTLNLKLP